MLEKYLSPYKSMTAKALLIKLDSNDGQMDREELLEMLDRNISVQLLAGTTLTRPACLAPLPLAGIPGWWPDTKQDDHFYNDIRVFRPPGANLVPAPVIPLP